MRLLLSLIFLFSIGNAKWISTYEFMELVGKGGQTPKDIRNKSYKLKFVAKPEEFEVITDSNGNITNATGNVKARIIKRIPQNTSLRCGEIIILNYNTDVVEWEERQSLAGMFQLQNCF